MKLIGKVKGVILNSKLSFKKISDLSKVSNRTIEKWIYKGVMPSLDKAEKVLNALGYELKIVKKEEV